MRVLLVVYDNGSYVHTFPQGTAYIAAVLRNAGHDVTVYNQDMNHHPDEHLTAYLDERETFDVIGLGVIGGYWQYRKMLSISKAIRASKNQPQLYVLGGHGPSPCPKYFLRKSTADIVVCGEGEATIVSLLNRLECDQGWGDILGIAYMENGSCVVNEKRPLLDVDDIPWPAYDLFPMEYYRMASSPNADKTDFVMPVASARGCTFRCNFCYRMDTGFRPRSVAGIIEEIEYLQRRYCITYIDFSDELLMSSEKRVYELCEQFLRMGRPFKWCCNGRLNYASLEILRLMKRAGCVFINYGIESFDDEALRRMNKHLTTDQIVNGVEATIAAGISPGLNVIWGNLGENKRTLRQTADFLLKYADTSQLRTIRPVTPYPGSDLFTYAVEHGLLKDVEEFYEQKHLNSDLLAVNFTDLSDDEFHTVLMETNCELLQEHYRRKTEEMVKVTQDLYKNRNVNFRGYRQM
jgi:radical SAM superfamily enzyme YgiQ (UPF0313 family)